MLKASHSNGQYRTLSITSGPITSSPQVLLGGRSNDKTITKDGHGLRHPMPVLYHSRCLHSCAVHPHASMAPHFAVSPPARSLAQGRVCQNGSGWTYTQPIWASARSEKIRTSFRDSVGMCPQNSYAEHTRSTAGMRYGLTTAGMQPTTTARIARTDL